MGQTVILCSLNVMGQKRLFLSGNVSDYVEKTDAGSGHTVETVSQL